MTNKLIIILCFLIFLVSCNQEKNINAKIYSDNRVEDLYGTFFSTKYGGLNYYISDENQRNQLFKIANIDSIILKMDNKDYVCKPIVDENYSRVINNSDFSFSISKQQHMPVPDRIDNKETLLFYSAKTDIEKLKDDGEIDFVVIDIP